MGIVVVFFLILFALILGAAKASLARKRVVLACCAMAWSLMMMTVARWAESLNYNIWYSGATESLIGAAVAGIEGGKQQEVVAELKKIHTEMEVTYENRGNYLDLAKAASERLKAAAANKE